MIRCIMFWLLLHHAPWRMYVSSAGSTYTSESRSARTFWWWFVNVQMKCGNSAKIWRTAFFFMRYKKHLMTIMAWEMIWNIVKKNPTENMWCPETFCSCDMFRQRSRCQFCWEYPATEVYFGPGDDIFRRGEVCELGESLMPLSWGMHWMCNPGSMSIHGEWIGFQWFNGGSLWISTIWFLVFT